MKTIYKPLSIFLLLIAPIFGFTQGEIQGKVFDEETNDPIPGAQVFVEIGGTKIGTTTDIDGRYKVKPLAAGTYDLHIKLLGMTPIVVENVVVNKEKITWINDMNLGTSITLKTAVVFDYTGSSRLIKPEDPTAITMLPTELEKNPLLRSPVDLIATIPGVSQKGDGQPVYFRGAREDAILYFVDGVKNRGGGLGIPSSSIGEITVYTGGIPAKYGDVTGGIIVVESKSYFDLYNANKDN